MVAFPLRAVIMGASPCRATPSDLTKDSKQTIVFFDKRVYFGVFKTGRHEGLGINNERIVCVGSKPMTLEVSVDD